MYRKVCILSFTPVTDEPRVLRQSLALAKDGWEVTVCGLKGRQEPPAWWSRFIEVEHVTFVPTLTELPGSIARAIQYGRLGASRISQAAAEAYYWENAGYAGIYEQIATIDAVRADFVIAHDYFTAPIAKRLADLTGAPFAIDIHEYARGQYMHDRKWRLGLRPWVDALQKRFLKAAAVNTTVCDGIADAVQSDYRLPVRPTVIRSTAFYKEMAFRPTDPDRIDVLYHGIISPMRGLEETIRSVPLWKPNYRCLMRGPGPQEYIASLNALAEEYGVADRVHVLEPVDAGDLVAMANKADIGFFIQPNISLQKQFALPNKFFEYVMSGMALCVADLPEMARLVKDYDLGVLVPDSLEPQQVADAVHLLTPDRIDHHKQMSLKAARELCWEKEASKMLELYNKILPASAPATAAAA